MVFNRNWNGRVDALGHSNKQNKIKWEKKYWRQKSQQICFVTTGTRLISRIWFWGIRWQRRNWQSWHDSQISGCFASTVKTVLRIIFKNFPISLSLQLWVCRLWNLIAKCELQTHIEQCHASGFGLRQRGKLCHKSQVSRSTRFTSPFHSLYLRSNFCVVAVVAIFSFFLLLNQHLLTLLTTHEAIACGSVEFVHNTHLSYTARNSQCSPCDELCECSCRFEAWNIIIITISMIYSTTTDRSSTETLAEFDLNWKKKKKKKNANAMSNRFFFVRHALLQLEVKQIGEKWSGFVFVSGLFSRCIYIRISFRLCSGIDGRQR